MLGKLVPLGYVLAFWISTRFLMNAGIRPKWRLDQKTTVMIFLITVVSFLTTSYLFFVFAATCVILSLAPKRGVPRIGTFLILILALPSLGHPLIIFGFSIAYLDWTRLLGITLLVPLLLRENDRIRLFIAPTDKYVFMFVVFVGILSFRGEEITGGIRNLVYLGLDVVIPYLAISRVLRSTAEVEQVLAMLLIGLVFVGLVNVFETASYWHVFGEVFKSVTGMPGAAYETRAGLLRAYGPLDRPSDSAFALATGLGVLWAIAHGFQSPRVRLTAVGILSIGLLLTFSRGSWIAGLLIGAGYMVTAGRKQLGRVIGGIFVLLVPLFAFDLAQRAADVFPFLGEQDGEAARTVDYREELFRASIRVANESPVFGNPDFAEDPRLVALRQPSGLIDIVNHYILIVLQYGYATLIVYLMVLLSSLRLLSRTRRVSQCWDPERSQIARALYWTVLAQMAAIATTSAVDKVGTIIWCTVGISAALANICQGARSDASTRSYPFSDPTKRVGQSGECPDDVDHLRCVRSS